MILFIVGLIVTAAFAFQWLIKAQATDETALPSSSPQFDTRSKRIIELDEPEWRQNIPLQAAVSESKVIVIGIPVGNECHLSQSGQVTTDYKVRIQEVIKGNIQSNTLVSVRVPGGLVAESDDTLLQARARRIRKMQNNRDYILFLKNSPGGGNAWSPIRGSQGLYEIPVNGTRAIHLGRAFNLPPADDGPEIASFLQQIRSLARNH